MIVSEMKSCSLKWERGKDKRKKQGDLRVSLGAVAHRNGIGLVHLSRFKLFQCLKGLVIEIAIETLALVP